MYRIIFDLNPLIIKGIHSFQSVSPLILLEISTGHHLHFDMSLSQNRAQDEVFYPLSNYLNKDNMQTACKKGKRREGVSENYS